MITLRSYQAGDLDAMHALDVVCFEKPFRFTRSGMRRFAEARKARVIIAQDDAVLAGFIILHIESADDQRIAYIVTLDIATEYRRRGLAGRLMQAAEHEAARAACVATVLHVFADNDPAIRFYESQGFTRTHRESNFYGPSLDAWVFQKLLAIPSH